MTQFARCVQHQVLSVSGTNISSDVELLRLCGNSRGSLNSTEPVSVVFTTDASVSGRGFLAILYSGSTSLNFAASSSVVSSGGKIRFLLTFVLFCSLPAQREMVTPARRLPAKTEGPALMVGFSTRVSVSKASLGKIVNVSVSSCVHTSVSM